MAFIVMPGTGPQEGMYLVCKTEGDHAPVEIVRSYEDELDALTICDEMNGDEISSAMECPPDDMKALLNLIH